MRGWDINAGEWREVPDDRWTVEWHTAPQRPDGLSDEEWELRLECGGHDMAISHYREFDSERKARAFAKRIVKQDWYGSVLVAREVPEYVEGQAFFWETVGEPDYVEA